MDAEAGDHKQRQAGSVIDADEQGAVVVKRGALAEAVAGNLVVDVVGFDDIPTEARGLLTVDGL